MGTTPNDQQTTNTPPNPKQRLNNPQNTNTAQGAFKGARRGIGGLPPHLKQSNPRPASVIPAAPIAQR